MKKLLLILLCLPIIGFGQNYTKYKEFNCGLYLSDGYMEVFPGASYLWGKTIYYNNKTLLDYEGGFAFPTIITGKIGYGIGNKFSAFTFGIRPIPTSLYLQYTWREKRLISFEFNTLADNLGFILNYGYRW